MGRQLWTERARFRLIVCMYLLLCRDEAWPSGRQLVNQCLAYVAVSRARYDAQVYTEVKAELTEPLVHDVSRLSAIEPAARKIARDVSHRSAIEPRRESVSPAHGIEPSTARSQVHEKRFSATASRGTRNSPRSFSAKTIPPLIPSLRVSTLTRFVAPTRGWPLATASYLAGASQIDQELSNPFAANAAKYHEVFAGIASIPLTNCRSVPTNSSFQGYPYY